MRERHLRPEEIELIRALLSRVSSGQELEKSLSHSTVSDMADGGMGSIRFVASPPQAMGKQLVEAGYVDSDGVLISIALNIDTQGRLYELDFWKVDFAPLKQYPRPENLTTGLG
jgi:hypothetical protein